MKDKRCYVSGINDQRPEEPEQLLQKSPLTDRTRMVFGAFIGAIIGGFLMNGMGVTVGVVAGAILGVILGADRG
jgi:uncharacterized membrane protein